MPFIEKTATASVYEIVNIVTGQRYVGSTKHNPWIRWGTHISQLRSRWHVNSRFQAAWDHSEIDDWSFRILEDDVAADQQNTCERAWFERLKPDLNIDQKPKIKSNAAKIEETLTLRQQGLNYRTIAGRVDMSLGWVGATLKRYELSPSVQ